MKRLLLPFIIGLSCTDFYSQKVEFQECGTDELMRKHYERFPEEKKRDDAFNLELSKLIKNGKIDALINKNQVYEIPVVVHVVGDGSAIGTINNRSDADIIAWINYTNNVLAGSTAGGMSPSSAVLPVKLVFAKTDPNCNATNGINRINASNLPKYVSGGVNNDNTTNAVAASEITALGMWDTSKYYNIYVVKKLASSSGTLNGFAYYPGGSNDYSFMSTNVSTVNAQTMAHEFGHALGLRHTFQGYNTTTAACPPNADCTLEGDLVCDTEPMISLYDSSVPHSCQTGQINSCTNQVFAGGERNIMAYTYCFRDLFTPGQATRATAQLLQYRQSLINSPVAGTTPINNSAALATACTPTAITNPGNYNIGITSVKFGNINNYSSNFKAAANNFYENFTGSYCLGVSKTTIPQNSATVLTIAPGTGTNSHSIRAYIDYNNDGQFNETTELVLNQNNIAAGSTASASITPPSTAVTNTSLRMRVIGDFNNTPITACYNPKYGQVEDYSVIIQPTSVLTVTDTQKQETVISKIENSVDIKSDVKISSLTIYEASGRLLVKQTNIQSTRFSSPVRVKNTVVLVNVLLENGKAITKKIKF